MRILLCMTALAAAAAAGGERPNVILVSLDQLGAGRLHCYGNPRSTSPSLDRMAGEGVRFERFYSAAPWTAPSYASMMTSQHPSRHGVTLFLPRTAAAIPANMKTLAEVFRDAGYETAAFVNNSVAGEYLTARGFGLYDEGQRRPTTITERSSPDSAQYKAPAVNKRVLEWLSAEHAKPFFLFLLYFEPHSPYDPSPAHDLFKSDAYPNESNTGYDCTKGRLFRLANLGDRKAIERLWQLYDGKIHLIDYYFGQVLDTLRTLRMDGKTIVFLTSDHGELIYSHAGDYMTFDHRSLYDPVMHVPAILWGAGIPKARVIRDTGTHIDIAPTLLELAGLPRLEGAQGRSLAPVMAGRAARRVDHIFGEQDVVEPLRSVRDGRYKLILNTLTGRKQLFDCLADPAELRDLANADPGRVAQLAAVLEDWRKRNEPPEAALLARWREVAAKSAKVHITDEMTIGANCQLTGGPWHADDNPRHNGGGAYWTEAVRGAETVRTARWRTDNPMLGRYRISIWYGPLQGAAGDVPFTVKTRKSERSLRINQTQRAGEWQELGIFEDPLWVELNNRAGGRVIADAVRFERLDE